MTEPDWRTQGFDLSGRNVVVIGGSKGIGRAIVGGFARSRANVWFTYRADDEAATELEQWSAAERAHVRGVRSDASNAAAIDEFARSTAGTIDRLDVPVNNVGDTVGRSSFAASDDALWTRSIKMNPLSTVRMTRVGDSLHYVVAKAGVVSFAQRLVRELRRIRIVGVAPSAVDTAFRRRHSSAERLARIVDATPLGRIGKAEEIAGAVLFLASDLASFVSGETLFMTGGR